MTPWRAKVCVGVYRERAVSNYNLSLLLNEYNHYIANNGKYQAEVVMVVADGWDEVAVIVVNRPPVLEQQS